MAESIQILPQNLDSKGKSIWTGYKNFADPTNMDVTDLAPGSRNVFISDGDKLDVRAGTDYFGSEGTDGDTINPYWSIAHRIHSKYDDFINAQGVKVPVRVYYSGTSGQGDVIQAWLPVDGDPATTTKDWLTVTATAPSAPYIPLSEHRYFFGEWWDQLNLMQRMVFVFGTNKIWSWTGGFAPVVSHTPTTITTTAGVSWAEKGFIDSPEGNPIIVVNGVEYTVTAGFGTDTVTVASTAGISDGDVAFHSIQANNAQFACDDITDTIFDVCSMVNNQVYYIDWRQRNVYVSWDKNQIAYLGIQTYQGTSGLNDAVFAGTYSGCEDATFEVSIDSINPDSEVQEFFGTGTGNGSWDTSAYSGGTAENIYKLVCVTDIVLTGVTPSMVPAAGNPAWIDQVFVGGTSGAIAVAVGGQYALSFVANVRMISGSFLVGETITGQDTGVTVQLFAVQTANAFQLFKNGTQIITAPFNGFAPHYFYQADLNGTPTAASIATTDGITFTFANPVQCDTGDYYQLTIQAGGPDTFSWSFNGENQGDNIAITGAAQALQDGVTVEFVNITGHKLGDTWTIKAYPDIERGWAQFYFNALGRLSGEGARLLLDSNGWTMKPQEKTMYINADAGHYYTVDRSLQNDLIEVLKVERLKSESQNKTLYPYLIGYDKNQLAAVSQDKTYDNLGRQELLELPQTKSISDEIRIDFETTDWEDGDFLYGKRKTFFVAPRSGVMFIWDDYKKYWHAPMTFARRIGLVSIIDDKVIGHSYERNESYELFTGTSDLEIYAIDTKMVFPYDSFKKRFLQKSSAAIGFEGYIEGNPEIFYTVNADIGGCNGQARAPVLPVTCNPQDRASLGKSNLGYHGLGNDPVDVIPHFFFIDTYEKLNYYQRNIELACESLDQRWSIVAIGTDVDLSNENNGNIVHRKQI